MKRLTIFLVAIISFFVIGCNEDDENIISTPTITTLMAEVPEDGGVIFSGELTQPDKITDHGFYYSRDSLFKHSNYVQISLGKPENAGEFEAIIEKGLFNDEVYYFKAFITVEDENIYDKTMSFKSNGSKPPTIDYVLPEKAHLGDTISINGKYFGQDGFYSNVYFNNKNTQVLSRNDSLITCIVPSDLDNSTFSITISANEKSDSIEYSLYTPVIESFSSLNGTFRDTISIFGNHFDIDKNRITIELNDLSPEITYASRTQIDFVIPDELNDSLSSIRLFSQVQWIENSDEFQLLAPIIDGIPSCTFTDRSLLIEGAYFHPILERNTVYIENIEAQLISGDTKSLTIEVPQGPFPRGQAELTVQLGAYNIKASQDICISDPWLMVSNTLPFSFYGDVGTFTVSDHAYVISDPIDYSDSEIALWKFNSSTNDWTKNSVPFEINHDGTCTSNNLKGYLYNTGDDNNFWEYDPASNQWSQKADFPGDSRRQAVSFSINDEIYVGSGVSYGVGAPTKAYCDFYKYNPSSDSWSQISDLDVEYCYSRYRASTFVIDEIAYLTAGASNTGMDDTWKYNSSTDEWIKVASFIDARKYTSSFTLNGKGYVANGTPVGGSDRKECWEYNPLSNSWRRFDDIGHKSRFRGFAFTVNDTAYVGGGSGYHDDVINEMFKLAK